LIEGHLQGLEQRSAAALLPPPPPTAAPAMLSLLPPTLPSPPRCVAAATPPPSHAVGPEPWQLGAAVNHGRPNVYREALRASGNAAMRRTMFWRPYAADGGAPGSMFGGAPGNGAAAGMHGFHAGDMMHMPTLQALGLAEWNRPAGDYQMQQQHCPFPTVDQLLSTQMMAPSGGYMMPPPPPLPLGASSSTAAGLFVPPPPPMVPMAAAPSPCVNGMQLPHASMQLQMQQQQPKSASPQGSPYGMLGFLMPGAENGGLNNIQIEQQLRAAAQDCIYED